MSKLLVAFASFALAGADAPKRTSESIPIEKQLEIRTAQLHVARLSDTLGKIAMQYQTLEKQHADAQAALTKLVNSLPKPKDCADCELSDALKWEEVKTEGAKK